MNNPLPIAEPIIRGKIRNELFAKQLRDFSGLQFPNKITPTDIDLFVEFNNRIFVIGEIKYSDTKLYYGQKLALERLSDCIGESKSVVLFIATHNTKPEDIIPVADCPVKEYRFRKQWIVPNKPFTVREFIDWFLDAFPKETES